MTTPPKDKHFLANIGYPWYVTAHWNEAMGYYIFADFQVDFYEGECTDTYFTTESFNEDEIISWIEYPMLPLPKEKP